MILNLSKVLERCTLDIQREKMTLDEISKLSFNQMQCLGVNHRNTMMKLRLKCLNFGSYSPPQKPRTQGCGAPEYLILKSVLESYMYLEEGFKIKDIASLLFVSESTV